MLIRGFVRTIATGNPVTDGTEVEFRRHVDNSLIATTATSGGMYELYVAGSPGPYYVRVALNEEVHISSSKVVGMSGPLDVGGLPLYFRLWTDGYIPGLLEQMSVFASGAGMQVTVRSGATLVKGVLYDQPGQANLTIDAPNAQPRIDTVVIETMVPGSGPDVEGRTRLVVKKGTPAATPTAPSLTQVVNGIWEHPLANVTVDPGVSSIASNKVTDRRVASNAQVTAGYINTTMLADGAVSTTKLADNSVTSAKIVDGTIATADLANLAVTNAKIADASIGISKLADGSVTSAKIVDGAIATADLGDGAVTTLKVADGAVTAAKLSFPVYTQAQMNTLLAGKSSQSNSTVSTVINGGNPMSSVGTYLGATTTTFSGLTPLTQYIIIANWTYIGSSSSSGAGNIGMRVTSATGASDVETDSFLNFTSAAGRGAYTYTRRIGVTSNGSGSIAIVPLFRLTNGTVSVHVVTGTVSIE